MQNPFVRLLRIAIVVIVMVLAVLQSGGSGSSDLYATWLAGEYFAAGDPAGIYYSGGPVYTMQASPDWIARDLAAGGDGALYPFIYPPLWAAVTAWLVPLVSFPAVAAVASWVNAALIVAMIALAWRAARVARPLDEHLCLAVVLTMGTFVGGSAIWENQPQILVSFLIVLAIERSRAGRDAQAGMALALAAALKLYPVLFAVFWIATGQRRALASFAITGAALAALSVLLAGWPLHLQFLEQIAAISNTVLLTALSYNLDPLIAQLFAADQFRVIAHIASAPEAGDPRGWLVMEKPALWALGSKAALIAAVLGLAVAMARADATTRYRVVWPVALVVVSLLAPLSWSYSYLPAFAFLPVLLDRYGARNGMIVILALTVPLFRPVVALYLNSAFAPMPHQLVGTLAIAGLVLAFALPVRTPAASSHGARGARGLRPVSPSL